MSVAITKKPEDVLIVNCNDIPETICVETRFITQAMANQMQNVNYQNVNLETKNNDQVPMLGNTLKPRPLTVSYQAKYAGTNLATKQIQPLLVPQPAATILPQASSALTNFNKGLITCSSTNVLNNLTYAKGVVLAKNTFNPATATRSFNDQMQQTDLMMTSIAIQCKRDEELDDIEELISISEESLENRNNSETEMNSFLNFIKDNSTQHKNYRECLICGEVSKSNKYFYGHMAVHRRPRILCSKCGNYIDNENLSFQHNCRKAQKLEKVFLQCPHHSCSVEAISRLELFDHINEHDNNRIYKCSSCRKGFCTAQEFLRHILIRAKCYTTAKRNRCRVYGLESQKDRMCRVRVFTLHTFKKSTTLVKSFLSQRVNKQGICKICLRSFTNKKVFNLHRVKCVMKFRKRLLRERRGKE